MKVILISADEAKKTKLEGADGLAKSDLIILFSTKNKTELPETVKSALKDIKAATEFVKMDSASEISDYFAYYIGYHEAKNHSVFIISESKIKVASGVSKKAKCYAGFASVVKAKAEAAKKTESKKKTSKKDEDPLSGVLSAFTEDGVDTKKLLASAQKVLKNVNK